MLLAAGCAGLPERPPTLASCERTFAAADAAAAGAGVHDAQAAPVPGFPYLRVDRFLASFRQEVADDDAAFAAWVRRLRDLDLQARAIELRRVHDDPGRAEAALARLDTCGQQLLRVDLADPARREGLHARATVPDAYRDAARVAGLYPFTVPFLKWGIARWHADVRETFGHPLPADADVVTYAPARDRVPDVDEAAAWLAAARRDDPLGVPELSRERLRALARRHAPVWQVATRGPYDRIGVPGHAAGRPGVTDPGLPVTYVAVAYTRFDGAVLLQLVYTAWFDRRPAASSIDPLAGALDGVVWRVTLDTDGRPLLADSIHPCGCYHHFFPGEALVRREGPGFWQEAPLVPAALPPGPAHAVLVDSGSHYLRAIGTAGEPPHAQRYALRPYAGLRERGLFGPGGLVPGSERLERWFLWPSGVPSPGAMRQEGNQATAFVGKRHFDDPFLVERYFRRGAGPPSD